MIHDIKPIRMVTIKKRQDSDVRSIAGWGVLLMSPLETIRNWTAIIQQKTLSLTHKQFLRDQRIKIPEGGQLRWAREEERRKHRVGCHEGRSKLPVGLWEREKISLQPSSIPAGVISIYCGGTQWSGQRQDIEVWQLCFRKWSHKAQPPLPACPELTSLHQRQKRGPRLTYLFQRMPGLSQRGVTTAEFKCVSQNQSYEIWKTTGKTWEWMIFPPMTKSKLIIFFSFRY